MGDSAPDQNERASHVGWHYAVLSRLCLFVHGGISMRAGGGGSYFVSEILALRSIWLSSKMLTESP